MVKCPWCGKEVSAEEYGSHYETCPRRKGVAIATEESVLADLRKRKEQGYPKSSFESLREPEFGVYYDARSLADVLSSLVQKGLVTKEIENGVEAYSLGKEKKWRTPTVSDACTLLMQRATLHLEEMKKEIDYAKEKLHALDETLKRIGVTDPEEVRKRHITQLEIHRHNLEIMMFLIEEDRDIAEALKCVNAVAIRRIHDIEALDVLREFDGWAYSATHIR
jgi:hypothetical protein